MRILLFLTIFATAGLTAPQAFCADESPVAIAPLDCGPGHKLKTEKDPLRYGQICVLENKPEIRDGPFELRLVKNGNLVQQGTYKNGNFHGVTKFYTLDGNLENAFEFQNGVMRKQTFYTTFDPKYRIKEVTLDEKGKFYGSRFWDLKGRLITESQFMKYEDVWSNLEEGKTEIRRLHDSLKSFGEKYKTIVSDMLAVGYTPFGHHRYGCGFGKPSEQTAKTGKRILNQRFNTMNKTFKKAAGKNFKYTGQATLADMPTTYIKGTKFQAACVARFGKDRDVWIVDDTGRVTHDSTLLD